MLLPEGLMFLMCHCTMCCKHTSESHECIPEHFLLWLHAWKRNSLNNTALKMHQRCLGSDSQRYSTTLRNWQYSYPSKRYTWEHFESNFFFTIFYLISSKIKQAWSNNGVLLCWNVYTLYSSCCNEHVSHVWEHNHLQRPSSSTVITFWGFFPATPKSPCCS